MVSARNLSETAEVICPLCVRWKELDGKIAHYRLAYKSRELPPEKGQWNGQAGRQAWDSGSTDSGRVKVPESFKAGRTAEGICVRARVSGLGWAGGSRNTGRKPVLWEE
jgi:hypothetical protein